MQEIYGGQPTKLPETFIYSFTYFLAFKSSCSVPPFCVFTCIFVGGGWLVKFLSASSNFFHSKKAGTLFKFYSVISGLSTISRPSMVIIYSSCSCCKAWISSNLSDSCGRTLSLERHGSLSRARSSLIYL